MKTQHFSIFYLAKMENLRIAYNLHLVHLEFLRKMNHKQ
jgi:hypothetical protein